ncbi:transposase [Saccharopolyspora gloriosae]|uniref:transposase n=1 Tax=Saccharopolyspora gloriosae TaxID=455344 RepID=UPI001FB722FF|nr:transposase [Saccharopolyspora gloriosae]
MRQTIPGWPYSIAAALDTGRPSWTAPLDAVRIGPHNDPTVVTAGQIIDLLDRLDRSGQRGPNDLPVLVVLDAGYELTRLCRLLAGHPVELVGRVRSNRVFYGPPPAPPPGRRGRLPRHGPKFTLLNPDTHPAPECEHITTHARYGSVRVRCSPGCTKNGTAGPNGPTTPSVHRSSKAA